MVKISTSNGTYGTLVNRQLQVQGGGRVLTDIAESRRSGLWGVNFNRLYRINARSGNIEVVGGLRTNNMNALGFDNQEQLYGAGGSGFYKINKNTGRATLISRLSNFLSSGDLAFDRSQNVFYATSSVGSGSELFAISRTGEAEQIGTIGFNNVFGLVLRGSRLIGYTSDGRELSINTRTGRGPIDWAVKLRR